MPPIAYDIVSFFLLEKIYYGGDEETSERNEEYHKLFDECILTRAKDIIIEYPVFESLFNNMFCYCPYSHKKEEGSIEVLANLLLENTVFFAFSESEVLDYLEKGKLRDLKKSAKYAYTKQFIDPDAIGTAGEMLLDVLIQMIDSDSQKMFTRLKVGFKQRNPTGYDAAYFSTRDSEIQFWLGQVKTNTSMAESKRGIMEDLQKNTKTYFSDYMFYVASRKEDKLVNIMNDLNSLAEMAAEENWDSDHKYKEVIKALKRNNVRIKLPCLMVFSHECYYHDDFKRSMDDVSDSIKGYFDEKIKCDDLKIEIDADMIDIVPFYIFPVSDVSKLRELVVARK